MKKWRIGMVVFPRGARYRLPNARILLIDNTSYNKIHPKMPNVDARLPSLITTMKFRAFRVSVLGKQIVLGLQVFPQAQAA